MRKEHLLWSSLRSPDLHTSLITSNRRGQPKDVPQPLLARRFANQQIWTVQNGKHTKKQLEHVGAVSSQYFLAWRRTGVCRGSGNESQVDAASQAQKNSKSASAKPQESTNPVTVVAAHVFIFQTYKRGVFWFAKQVRIVMNLPCHHTYHSNFNNHGSGWHGPLKDNFPLQTWFSTSMSISESAPANFPTSN